MPSLNDFIFGIDSDTFVTINVWDGVIPEPTLNDVPNLCFPVTKSKDLLVFPCRQLTRFIYDPFFKSGKPFFLGFKIGVFGGGGFVPNGLTICLAGFLAGVLANGLTGVLANGLANGLAFGLANGLAFGLANGLAILVTTLVAGAVCVTALVDGAVCVTALVNGAVFVNYLVF